ncbi:hypothetical protein TWF481_000028 [Arthrobotrys musiformis]|uniref:Uncharacterized protein n=1 Tax=Arthrobotrys musiformis TaxID=47236 RepID=A0AAV9WLL3_9PEZI
MYMSIAAATRVALFGYPEADTSHNGRLMSSLMQRWRYQWRWCLMEQYKAPMYILRSYQASPRPPWS